MTKFASEFLEYLRPDSTRPKRFKVERESLYQFISSIQRVGPFPEVRVATWGQSVLGMAVQQKGTKESARTCDRGEGRGAGMREYGRSVDKRGRL
eukprot:4206791-Pleurochrysis_carterae.AAC.1